MRGLLTAYEDASHAVAVQDRWAHLQELPQISVDRCRPTTFKRVVLESRQLTGKITPELARILKPRVNLERAPITRREEMFVQTLIHHLHSAYCAMKAGLFSKPDRLELDIQTFFSLPIPAAVWARAKLLHDHDLVCFVDSLMAGYQAK